MQANTYQRLFSLGSRALVKNCNYISVRTNYKKPFSWVPVYRGKFEYHDNEKYPRSLPYIKEEELLDEVHELRNKPIDEPSPFHIVKRIRGNAGSIKGWQIWVTLRRLNLHSTVPGDTVIVPNTPQFNSLLYKVKHLLRIVPAKLPSNHIPDESDIGALKVCPCTGEVIIDEKLRLQSKREYEQPRLWQGNTLGRKLKRLTGLHHKHYLR